MEEPGVDHAYVDIYSISNHSSTPSLSLVQTITAPSSLAYTNQLWGWNVEFDRTGNDLLVINDELRKTAVYKYNNPSTPYTLWSEVANAEFTPTVPGSSGFPGAPARELVSSFISPAGRMYVASGSPRVDAPDTDNGVVEIYQTNRSISSGL